MPASVPGPAPVALVISLRVLPGRREDFLAGISRNASAAVREEPGCLRFDVVQDGADPDVFRVYEVFADREALLAHRGTAHFLAWQRRKAEVVVPGSQVDHLGSLAVSEG
ncbi:putative quinol monooxygenase [Nocardiopsis tropica]|uniref:Quinol monooxygenase n=1 Tax=Nocardiopsis tropica TaxID=109330 RepID=A0ABV1ZQQ4_9ACTN